MRCPAGPGVIEAKRFSIDPHGGKPQARANARPRQFPADPAVDKAIIEDAANPNF